jgi:hypothetical protein
MMVGQRDLAIVGSLGALARGSGIDVIGEAWRVRRQSQRLARCSASSSRDGISATRAYRRHGDAAA